MHQSQLLVGSASHHFFSSCMSLPGELTEHRMHESGSTPACIMIIMAFTKETREVSIFVLKSSSTQLKTETMEKDFFYSFMYDALVIVIVLLCLLFTVAVRNHYCVLCFQFFYISSPPCIRS